MSAPEDQPDTVPADPEGPDPEGIPDPMPDELQQGAAAEERLAEVDDDPMEGPAPTG